MWFNRKYCKTRSASYVSNLLHFVVDCCKLILPITFRVSSRGTGAIQLPKNIMKSEVEPNILHSSWDLRYVLIDSILAICGSNP